MEFIRKYHKFILCCIPLLSLLLHWYVFDLDLVGIHVWRQTETQNNISNFYREDFNILHPRMFEHADTDRILRMEFPIMQWIFAIFFRVFGAHIVISRILSFIMGLLSVYGMFYLCNNIFKNNVIAVICAWCFNFSPVFYYYTINPMPDNMALCCGIWSVGFFYSYINTAKMKYVVWSAILLSLAALVKLPFILYGSVIFAFFLLQLTSKKYPIKKLLQIAAIYAILIIPAVAWYCMVIPTWGNMVVLKGILDVKQSRNEMLDIVWAYIISILPELIINYGSLLFFVAGFYFMFKRKIYLDKNFTLFLFWGISIMLYFIFEINTINTVHDYYLFPFLPTIFLVVAYGAYRLLSVGGRYLTGLTIGCLAILPVTAFVRAYSRWDIKEPGFNAVYYNNKDILRRLTPQNAYCIVGNDASGVILLYYIDRKGWAYDGDQLDENQLAYYISKGASYLFTDGHVDDKPGIKSHLGDEVFAKENVRVYKLK
jgi:4-amino-4-deoxy-L-arabinose transferase-like glycosyltransferase